MKIFCRLNEKEIASSPLNITMPDKCSVKETKLNRLNIYNTKGKNMHFIAKGACCFCINIIEKIQLKRIKY